MSFLLKANRDSNTPEALWQAEVVILLLLAFKIQPLCLCPQSPTPGNS